MSEPRSRVGTPATRALRLQWGRDHLIAEMEAHGVVQRMIFAASMGPRSSDRGNNRRAVNVRSPTWKLQWGRDHLIAEMRIVLAQDGQNATLQWGRDHLIAEIATA